MLLEVRWETKRPFVVSRKIEIPINFQEESGLVTFEALNSTSLRGVKRCEAPCPDEAGN